MQSSMGPARGTQPRSSARDPPARCPRQSRSPRASRNEQSLPPARRESVYQRPPTGVLEILAVLTERLYDLDRALVASGLGRHLSDTIDDLLQDEMELVVGRFRQLAVSHHIVDLGLDTRRQRG